VKTGVVTALANVHNNILLSNYEPPPERQMDCLEDRDMDEKNP